MFFYCVWNGVLDSEMYVLIPAFEAGLNEDSVVNVTQIVTVDRESSNQSNQLPGTPYSTHFQNYVVDGVSSRVESTPSWQTALWVALA